MLVAFDDYSFKITIRKTYLHLVADDGTNNEINRFQDNIFRKFIISY